MISTKRIKLIALGVILIVILMSFIGYLLFRQSITVSPSSQIANPASVYCIENKGTLEMRFDDQGNQYGICTKNGIECEEWKFFRGECEL